MRKFYKKHVKKIFQLRFVNLFFSLILTSNLFAQNQQVYNTAGAYTFQIPAGVTQITVETWGAGGRGAQVSGAGTTLGGGGGGGGAYSRSILTVIPGNTYYITVGAGSSTTTAGEDSWFAPNNNVTNAVILAKGGSSAANNSGLAAPGGLATSGIGAIKFNGGSGAAGSGTSYSGGGGASGASTGVGNSGNANLGGTTSAGGAGGNGSTSQGAGSSGNIPGGGGGGALKTANGNSTQNGGSGGSGKVLISYFTLSGVSSSSICSGSSANITVTSSPTTSLPAGIYTVTYNLSSPNAVTGATALLTVSGTGGSGTFSTSSLPIAGSTTITVTNLASSSGLYSNAIGTNNTSTITVTSAPQPTISAGGSTTFCTGSNVVLTSSAASSYKWYVDGSPIGGATNQTYTATASGTYTVVTTNAAGCTSPASAGTIVTVNALPATPTVSANGPLTFCADGSLTLTSTSASSYQWYKGGVAISGATAQTYSPTTTGNYTVVVKNASGCSSTASSGTSVTVNALPPTPAITPSGPTAFCFGGNVTLTSDIATTYQWYDGNGIITGATNRNYTTSTTGSYFVRVTNASGCSAVSGTQAVANNPLPDISIASQATSLCSNTSSQTSQLTYSNTDNAPNKYSITWNAAAISAGFSNVIDANLPANSIPITVPANAATNTYSGSLTVKNANGCQSSAKAFTVNVTSSPNVSNFSVSAANGCVGIGAIITINSSSIGDGTYNINYDLSGANTATGSVASMVFSGNTGTFTVATSNIGLTNITVNAVARIGCSTPVTSGNTASFTINTLPAAPSISGPADVCVGASIDLDANVSGGSWSSSEPSVATVDNNGIVTGIINGTTIITFTTDANSNGCTNSATKTITVNALPTVQAITGPTLLCINTSSNLNNATPNGTWSSSNTSVATVDNTGLVNAISLGTTIITYTTTVNAAGCTNSTAVTVTVSSEPGVTAGPALEVCESPTPTATALTGASYSGGATSAIWSIEPGGSGSLSNQGAGTNPSGVTYTPAANFHGTVILKLTTNSVGSCGAAVDTRTITLTERPLVVAGSNLAICQSSSPSAITLSGATVSGGASTGAWSIQGGAGGVLSDNSQLADPSIVTYTPPANFSGVITLRLTTNSIGICSPAFADKVITVTATPTVNAGSQNSICQSASPSAFALSGASFGGGATQAAWSITSGTGTLSNTSPTNNPAAVTFQPTANFFGTVKLTLTSDAPGGCGSVTSERIIDITQASTVIAGGPNTVCQSATPGAITLTGASVGGGATTGAWSLVSAGGGTLSSTAQTANPETVTFTPDANFNGVVTLSLTANATGNCSPVSATRTITVSPNGTIALTSAVGTDAQTKCINNAITNIKYTIGGNATGASLTAGAFPTGVTGSFSGGIYTITGTPSVAGLFNYTLSTSGSSCVNESVSGTITVTANGLIALTSAAATTSQSPCINTALTPITYAVSGSAINASITSGALPTGVTGTFNNGVFTISGTPSVSGTFNYTVTTAGPCVNNSLSGTITVRPNATISLTSAAATNAQTVCVNTPITNITYNIGGGGTGATVSGLPSGVTGSYSAGVFTISGSPTVSGTFPYTVNTTGTCTQTSATGTIIVNPASVGGTLSPALKTFCSTGGSGSITLSGHTGLITMWQSSTNGGFSWTNISNTTPTLNYNVTATTLFRAVIQSGSCTIAYSNNAVVSVIPANNPTIASTVPSPPTICAGQTVLIQSGTGYPSIGIQADQGDFHNANPEGFVVDGTCTNCLNAGADNGDPTAWREKTNGGSPYVGIGGTLITYQSPDPKFAIVAGQKTSTLETPIFSLIAQTSGLLKIITSYMLEAGASAKIEISTSGGSAGSYVTLQQLTGQYGISSSGTNRTGILAAPATPLDLSAYLGLSNLRLRFSYVGTTNSSWALDNVNVPGTLPITYTWTDPSTVITDPTLDSIRVKPPVTTSYTITTFVGGCPAGSATVTVNVNPVPVIANQTPPAMCSPGAITLAAANFTGTNTIPPNTTYSWTAPVNAGLTGLAGGTDQTSFTTGTLTNVTNAPITVIYSVTPKAATGSCAGTAFTITVTVNPKPFVANQTPPAVCSPGSYTLTPANGSGNVVPANTTYTWSAPVVAGITGLSGGTAQTSFSTGTLTNTTNAPITVTYTVTPTSGAAGNCVGQSFTITVIVNPKPFVTNQTPAAFCSPGSFSITPANGTGGNIIPASTTYTWPLPNAPGVSGQAASPSPQTSFNTGILTNNTNAPITVVYSVTPTSGAAGTCVGNPFTVSVTLNPLPALFNVTGGGAYCTGGSGVDVSLSGSQTGISYQLFNGATAVGTPINGTGSAISFGNQTVAGTYTIVATNTATTCTNNMNGSVIVSVNPIANISTQPSDIVFCPESNTATFTVAATGASIYQWQFRPNATTAWTNVPAAAPYTGQASAALTISGLANLAALDGYQYQVLLNPSSACPVTSGFATLSVRNIWKGITSTDWNTPSNWSGGLIPTLTCENVIVLASTPMGDPILSSGAAGEVNSLIIMPGATVTVTGNTLKIAGTITDDDNALNATNGKIELNGNIGLNGVGIRPAQTIAGRMFATPKATKSGRIKDLQISNPKGVTVAAPTVTDTLNITGHLSFGAVSGVTFTTNDNVTLISDANGTASVDEIAINGSGNAVNNFNGKMIVERFIPGHRAWRLLTTPLVTSQTINQAWQEGAVNQTLPYANNNNPHPGYGTHITGIAGGTDWAIGYDMGPFNNYSLKVHDRARNTYLIDGYRGIEQVYPSAPGMNTPINYLEGYMVFVRGGRDIDLNLNTAAPPTNTVLRAKGTLKTGTQTITQTVTGFNLVGNPFASTLDLSKITQNGVAPEFVYVYDPRAGSIGNFQTLFLTGGSYSPIPGGGSYGAPYNIPGNNIQSGQAFFVQSVVPGSVVIKEQAKDLTANSMIFSPVTQPQQLRTNLYVVNTSTDLLDATLTQYSGDGNNAVDGKDAMKIPAIGAGTYLGMLRDGKNLIIERRQTITTNDTIFYNLMTASKRNYRFEFVVDNMESDGVSGFLEDAYLNTSTPVNLNGTTTLDFTVNTDAASAASDRFRLVFKAKVVPPPLPFTFKNVQADLQTRDIAVKWVTENESDIKSYDIETSANGLQFVTSATITAKRGGTENYQWLDTDTKPGTHYYRIRSVNDKGDVVYSSIVSININMVTSRRDIRVYPNPVTEERINLMFSNQPEGNYNLRLVNALGQVMLTKQIYHASGSSMKTLKVSKNMVDGIYKLEITRPDKSTYNINVILQ